MSHCSKRYFKLMQMHFAITLTACSFIIYKAFFELSSQHQQIVLVEVLSRK